MYSTKDKQDIASIVDGLHASEFPAVLPHIQKSENEIDAVALWQSGLCQRSVELPFSIFAEMDFFSMPPHWTNRPSAIPEAWHVLCETGWGATWFESDSFCCQCVKRLWSSTVGQNIISRSVASGFKKMQYLPTDLGPVFQRCLQHD